MLTSFFIYIQNSGQLSLLELPSRSPLCHLVHLAPSANAALAPHPCLQISYLLSAYFVSLTSLPPQVPRCFSIPRTSSYPLTCSRFFNGMLEVFEPGALNFYTLSHLIPLTLFVSRNRILIHLPLTEFLDSLLSDLIALTPGLAFFLPLTRTLATASSFLLDSACPSSNFLPPSLSSLDPHSDYVGFNNSLSNSSLLFALNVYAFSICFPTTDAKPTPFLPSLFSSPEMSFSEGLQLSSPPLGLKTWGGSIRLSHHF